MRKVSTEGDIGKPVGLSWTFVPPSRTCERRLPSLSAAVTDREEVELLESVVPLTARSPIEGSLSLPLPMMLPLDPLRLKRPAMLEETDPDPVDVPATPLPVADGLSPSKEILGTSGTLVDSLRVKTLANFMLNELARSLAGRPLPIGFPSPAAERDSGDCLSGGLEKKLRVRLSPLWGDACLKSLDTTLGSVVGSVGLGVVADLLLTVGRRAPAL